MADSTTPALRALDVDSLHLRMQNAPGFPHLCVDDFLEPGFAEEVHDAFPSFAEAGKLGQAFASVNERRKIQITDARRFPAPIRCLHEALVDPDFVRSLSAISGIPNLVADPDLVGAGIHETNHGGRLDVHVDFNVHLERRLFRRLNLLVYFNKGWRDEDGGILDLWDADVRHCVARIAPTFNRAAAFATSSTSWHGVTPVTSASGRLRRSFACYYYTTDPPPGWNGVAHSTIFRPRPDERWRGVVAVPAESLARAAERRLRAAVRRLRASCTT